MNEMPITPNVEGSKEDKPVASLESIMQTSKDLKTAKLKKLKTKKKKILTNN